jgi:hypothetical protein
MHCKSYWFRTPQQRNAQRSSLLLRVSLAAMTLAILTGCGSTQSAPNTAAPASPAVALAGRLHSGQQPVSGSSVQLYAAGTSGVGSASLALLSAAVQSDSSGNFSIPATYSCPSPSSQIYLLAQGGNPGLTSGSSNAALALAAVLGSCSGIPALGSITVNEVTTVGSVWPLAHYLTSPMQLGSATGDATFTDAVANVLEFFNLAQGTSPGKATSTSSFTETDKLYSLADVLAACNGSSGGKAGDGSACGSLFSLTTLPGSSAPTDSMTAAIRIAQNPGNTVTGLFDLVTGSTAFQPVLTAAPSDWSLPLTYVVATPSISPGTGTYNGTQQVTITDTTGGATIYYTTDGTVPTTSSPVYQAPISIDVTSTVQAIGVFEGSPSAVASAKLTIIPVAAKLAFVQEPSNTVAQTVISPAITVAVEDSNGNPVTTASNPVTLALAGGTGLGGTLTVTPKNGIATFSNLTVSTTGTGYTLSATSAGLISATSTSFTISAPITAVQLAFLQQPTNASTGATFTPAVTVEVQDNQGNIFTTASSPVTLALIGGTGLRGTLTVTPQNGIATFSNLTVSTAGNYTLSATSSGLGSATSAGFTVTGPYVGNTYYLSATGDDANSGLSANLPWLSPNHALNCGDTILAAPGTNYQQGNFADGQWGAVTCSPGSAADVAWLKCATFDGCKLAATNQNGMWVTASYWGVQGWEVSAIGEQATCFASYPPTSTANLHHIIFANDIANGCYGAGFEAIPNGAAGTDYFILIGNIAYNAAQQTTACGSGISIFEPVEFDTLPGTHIYVAGNYTWDNVDGNPCGGGTPTDGEGIVFDTFDAKNYTQQAVMENNLAFLNGSSGFRVDQTTQAPVYLVNNTAFGDNTDTQLNTTYCGEITLQQSKGINVSNNIARTNAATGCGTNPNYALFVGLGDGSDVVKANFAYGISGLNAGQVDSGGFSFAASNILGLDPLFVNPPTTDPGAPHCANSTNVAQCMATTFAGLLPQAATAIGVGIQPLGGAATSDPLFPSWLCNVSLPAGLIPNHCP